MLQTVQRQTLWSAVFKMQEQERSPEPSPSEADDTDTSAEEAPARAAPETPALAFSLWTPLSYTDGWSDVVAAPSFVGGDFSIQRCFDHKERINYVVAN